MMFRTLPVFGTDPRTTAEIVNGIMNGKTNNTGLIELNTGGATTTTITNERISPDSVVTLTPISMTAATSYYPYGSFQDLTDQSIVSTTAAYPITYNTTDFALGVSVQSGSQVKVDYSGLYNIQFSIQFTNTDSQIQDISVWFRKNGVDVPASNSEFSINERHGSTDGRLIAGLNFLLELAKNDYFQIMWHTSNVAVSMQHIAAQTSPTRPATPSVLLSVCYVSSNSFTTNLFADAYISAQTNGSATITHPENTLSGVLYKYVIVG